MTIKGGQKTCQLELKVIIGKQQDWTVESKSVCALFSCLPSTVHG